MLRTCGSFKVCCNEQFSLDQKRRGVRIMRMIVKVDRCDLWADVTVCVGNLLSDWTTVSLSNRMLSQYCITDGV